jgi:hypothetical protein
VTRPGSRKGLAAGLQLDPDIVANHEKLGGTIGEFAESDVECRAASRKIVRLQEQLRELVGEDAWQTYLALETAVNDRNADFDETLVRWAFAEGQKHPVISTEPADRPVG